MAEYLVDKWIALAALLLSAWALYRTHFLPFSVLVRPAGRITLAKNPWAMMTQDCFALDLTFTNTGTTTGAVEDVAVYVTGADTRVLLRTMGTFADRQIQVAEAPVQPKIETFAAFTLTGREAAVKRILFVPDRKEDVFTLQVGAYVAAVYVRGTGLDSWKNVCSVDFTVAQEDFDALAQSRMVPEGAGFRAEWRLQDKATETKSHPISALKNQLFGS